MVVLYVIGRRDAIFREIDDAERRGQSVAIVQCCLRSTLRPSTADWVDGWKRATVVWSYLDLRWACADDGVRDDFAFYHAPLGSDATVFKPGGRKRHGMTFAVATSGQSWLTESVKECALAAQAHGRQTFHLGPDLHRDAEGVTCVSGIDDAVLASWYRLCDYVSGLRRIEGFELPALEGLLCGARPVLFNREHYRRWYGDHAIYIDERDRGSVTSDLVRIFADRPARVTADERQHVAETFAWAPIATGFWERAL